nr:hypothetical protein [Tanacetum cinerariifolium]
MKSAYTAFTEMESHLHVADVKYSKPENPNKLFQKLLEDLKELAEYENSPKQEIPPQDSDICHLIREECCVKASEEQKQSMEDTMLELVKICHQKELLCIHDNVEDLIESALNTKLLLINSQRLDKKKQVKNVVEQPAERGNQPEYSSSMGYENPNTTLETESDEIIKSGVEELVPILSENEVTFEDKRECNVLSSEDSSTCDICNDHSEIFFDSKDDDYISSDDDDFEDVEYVEASFSNPEIVNQEAENDVEKEEVDLEDISQIQDVGLIAMVQIRVVDFESREVVERHVVVEMDWKVRWPIIHGGGATWIGVGDSLGDDEEV